MADDGLRDYLLKQARSLDSLLELTPAKHLFGEDVSDQWKRKKQTPEQKKAARMAKLDPANWKSAKDVYDERSAKAAKKRKREAEEGYDGEENAPQEQPVKKQKNDETDGAPKQNPVEKLTERLDRGDIQNKNLLKKAKKRANQKERKRQKKERKEQAKVQRQSTDHTVSAGRRDTKPATQQDKSLSGDGQKAKSKSNEKFLPTKSNDRRKGQEEKSVNAEGNAERNAAEPRSGANQPQTGLEDEEDDSDDAWSDTENDEHEDGGHDAHSENENDSDEDEEGDDDVLSAASFSEAVSDTFSPQDSAASSVSSIVPPQQSQSAKLAEEAQSESRTSDKATPRAPMQTDEQRQSARQRLQEQISQFRSQRKADEKPVRSRADLLLQRRQKELEKKAAKKEQRRKEKEEEARRQDEEIAKRFSPGGSGSLLASPRSPMIDDDGSNGFTFGRIAFEDGTQFDPSTGSAAAKKKHKGPADPATALKAVQAKQARVAGLDEQKRQDIAEKDMWLNAKRRAHGERVKDDTSLLKKALKRHEKQKQRSEKEWDERIEGVKSSQEAKQKRRAENIQKRKDEKFAKKTGAGKKKVKRPGFEGSFRSRSGKSKK